MGCTRWPDPPRAGCATWHPGPAALSSEPESGGGEQGEREPEQGRELADASTEPHHLLPKFRFCEVDSMETDHFPSVGGAKMAIFDYIEVFYNQRRRHSTLGQISPAAFERRAAA
jgi:hypothetical protein